MRPLADDSLTGLPPAAASMVAARITLGDDAVKIRILVFGSGNNNRCADDYAVAQTPTSGTRPGVHAVAAAALLHLRLDELVAVDLAFTGADAEALVSERFLKLWVPVPTCSVSPHISSTTPPPPLLLCLPAPHLCVMSRAARVPQVAKLSAEGTMYALILMDIDGDACASEALAAHCRLSAYRGGTLPLIAVGGGGVAWARKRHFDGSLPSPATLASLAPLIASFVVPEILTAVRPAAALIAAWQRQASDRPSPSPSPSAAPPPLPYQSTVALSLDNEAASTFYEALSSFDVEVSAASLDNEEAAVSPFDAAHAGWRMPLLRKRERSWSHSDDDDSSSGNDLGRYAATSSDEDEGSAAEAGGGAKPGCLVGSFRVLPASKHKQAGAHAGHGQSGWEQPSVLCG
jgi:hypothetical protein